MKKVYISLLLSLFVVGCKLPLHVIGKGDLISVPAGRDCLYEQAIDPNDPTCENNIVLPPDDYYYTHRADPRPGWHFHRWASYCKNDTINECSFAVPANVVANFVGFNSPTLIAIFRPDVVTGFKSLYMGHSLFNPIAVGMPDETTNAGLFDHTQTNFFFPAQLGSPINIWNDPIKKAAVQSVLDQGDVDVFGMAIHHDILDSEGYLLWADYAIEQNPDTRIFIGMPWEWYPDLTTAALYDSSWHSYYPATLFPIIDELRAAHPHNDFYAIPYGQAAVELYNLYDAGNLPDVQHLIEDPNDPNAPAIFTDSRGHPDDILIALGELVWLSAIYGVDMSSYNSNHGYMADLEGIAHSIMTAHDPNYNAP